jgi:putative peptidoglycan lipid II flippase
MKKTSFTGQTLGAVLVTALAKIMAFIRTAVCAAIFGATGQTDAFFMAIGVITIISGPSTSLTTVIVPMRTKILAAEGPGEADKFTSALLNLTLALAFGAGILMFFFAPQLVKVFAPRFIGETYTLTVLIVRLFMPLIMALSLMSLFCGVLNTHHRFVAANLTGLALNIGWVAVPLLLAARLGIFAMVWGYILGALLQIVVLLPSLREVFRYRFSLTPQSDLIRPSVLMCLPIFIGTFYQQINQIIDKALASGLNEGSISALGYATQLITLVEGIISIPIAASLFSLLSGFVQNKDLTSFKQAALRGFSVLALILLPITGFSLIYESEIVCIVFQRGAFDEAALSLTRSAFIFYSLGFLPAALVLVLIRCFYVLYDTRTPLYISLLGIVVNILLNITLVRFMGLGGLALATSIASVVTFSVMTLYLRKKIGALGLASLRGDMRKTFAALVVCLGCAWGVKISLAIPPLMSLFAAAAAGLSAYAAILILLKQGDMLALLKKVKSVG